MRLDKMISSTGIASRSQISAAVKARNRGRFSVTLRYCTVLLYILYHILSVL